MILAETLDDLVPLAKFCELNGITRNAIYQQIYAKKIRINIEYRKDPDGKIWISRKGSQQWILSGSRGQEESNPTEMEFKSSSSSRAKRITVMRPYGGARPRLI